MPSIFDFDQTISIKHTFADHALELALQAKNVDQQYEIGKKESQTNTKQDLELVLKHDANNLSAIATYHNNPNYVAGYIANHLKKELTLVETTYSSNEPIVAIAHYKVEGIDKPFLISYLPHQEDKFQSTMAQLGNKNKQIEFLRQTWLEKQLIQRTTVIDFYEDSETNFLGARGLKYIKGNLVNMFNTFKITDTDPVTIKTTLDANKIAQLDAQLTIIKNKALSLRKKGHNAAAFAADELYTSLSQSFDELYFGKMELPEFQEKCKPAIEKAHIELDKHRGWKEFLGNLAYLIFGLGIGLLIKGVNNLVNKKPFLFFEKTDSTQILDTTAENIVSLTVGA